MRASNRKSKKFRADRKDFSIGNDDVDVFFRNKKLKLRLLMVPAEARALANHLNHHAQILELAEQARKVKKKSKDKAKSTKVKKEEKPKKKVRR